MSETLLFTDGSVNTKTKTGFGAYLAIPENMELADVDSDQIKLKRFENTSSTKLELQTLLWAIKEVKEESTFVKIYTDSQNISGLLQRRDRLEKNDYYSRQNKRINNFELYREFFKIADSLDCEIIKVKGHKKGRDKNRIERFFTRVDRASRKALRSDTENES